MGKKQHFVPQFLLRHFSSDPSRKRISLFYIPTSQVIKYASLKDQAYKKNIYGSDQTLENILCKIETEGSLIINEILLAGTISLTPKEETILKLFINLQISRTPEKIATIQKQFDKMTKLAFRHDPRVKDFIEDFTIELTSPYHFAMVIAWQIAPLLFDLKVRLLKNEAREPLLIGQHPAIVTNPFLYQRNWVGSKQGLGLKGALIILPLSPKYAVALYDRKRYGIKDFKPIGVLSQNDVNIINLFQFCYTTDCIYFYDDGNTIDFNGYKNATEEFRDKDKAIVKAYGGRRQEEGSIYFSDEGNGHGLKGYTVKDKTMTKTRISQVGKRKDMLSELIMSTTREPPIIPRFDFICLKVGAVFEDLGSSMDVSREGVMDLMDKIKESTKMQKISD